MVNSQLKFKPGQIRGLRLRLSLQRSGKLNPAVRQEVLRWQVQSTRFKAEFKGFITGQNISAGPRFPGCNSLKPTTQRCVCKERQPCPQLPFQQHQAENKHLNKSWTWVNNRWTLHGGFRGKENGQSSAFTLHCQRGRAVLVPTHAGVFSCILQL